MPKTVLVIEDDEDSLDIITYMLTYEGYVVFRSYGPDAIELASNTLPDLIILDHRLQDCLGSDVCRSLKVRDLTKNIPVMMLSAMMDIEERSASAGADSFLAKPFDMETLLTMVADLMHKTNLKAAS